MWLCSGSTLRSPDTFSSFLVLIDIYFNLKELFFNSKYKKRLFKLNTIAIIIIIIIRAK